MDAYCGIDWAEDHHDVALVDVHGRLLARQRIGDDSAGLTALLALGALTGARVLAEIGDDRTRFHDAKGLKAYAGVAPITRASGKTRAVLHRRVKNNGLNAAGYNWAFSALSASPRCPRPLRPPSPRTRPTRRRPAPPVRATPRLPASLPHPRPALQRANRLPHTTHNDAHARGLTPNCIGCLHRIRAGFVGHHDPALAPGVSITSADIARDSPERRFVAKIGEGRRRAEEMEPGDLFASDPVIANPVNAAPKACLLLTCPRVPVDNRAERTSSLGQAGCTVCRVLRSWW